LLEWMPGFVFGDACVGALGTAHVASLGVGGRVYGITVVRIDHMTARAAGRADIAGMIVGSQKIESRVKQARLLQSQIDRISAVAGAKAARTQTLIRFTVVFIFVGNSNFQSSLATPLKHPQDVAGLSNFPMRNRIQKIEKALFSLILCSRCWRLDQTLRSTVFAIAFGEASVFQREATVIV